MALNSRIAGDIEEEGKSKYEYHSSRSLTD